MRRQQRVRALWIALVGAVILSAVIVPLWVTADSGQVSFTATLYSDVIRFEADGVASLRVTIYDLSENELWSSGQVMGDFVDWDRANARGERLANGLYLYLAQGWDSSDTLILNKTGKVVLLPGDQVELRAAPTTGGVTFENPDITFGTKAVGQTAYYSYIDLSGVNYPQYIMLSNLGGAHQWSFFGSSAGFYIRDRTVARNPFAILNSAPNNALVLDGSGYLKLSQTSYPQYIMQSSLGGAHEWSFFGADTGYYIRDRTAGLNSFGIQNSAPANSLIIESDGDVGIGTNNATDRLTIQYNGGNNAIAVYPGSSRVAGAAVFRVESDGDVYADGIAYAANFITGGSADVAERINVSEWVEAGDVVEIDPDHAGFFRKASGLYSRRVAGIISTSPGVILGNDIDPTTDQWDDNRPVLAIAGRVPVKASTENGPIAVGDLLVSSSVPGVAMKGDPAVSIGAVVGKAMEPLESGEGIIMSQVTLR